MTTEFRRDPIIGHWVLVHTEDSLAPEGYDEGKHTLRQAAICQFCPGKEYLTPPEVDAVRDGGSGPNQSGWRVRVISNKFPALKIEGDINKRLSGMYQLANGVGAHEVILETPEHAKQTAGLSVPELADVIRKYQSRINDLSGDKRFKYIIVFKNYGEAAGASIEHAHSQIIALPMIPKYVLEELMGTSRYYRQNHRCIYCDLLQQEYQEKARIIAENDAFVSLCPFVSRYPFECWVLPRQHCAKFMSGPIEEYSKLAKILSETLQRIKLCLGDPAYNFYLHIPPVNMDGPQAIDQIKSHEAMSAGTDWLKEYHWHFEIVPKLTYDSGFEWGTGFYVVKTSPEKAAAYLRKVQIHS